MEVCDDDDDGVAVFDLTTQTPAVLNGRDAADYTVSYYETLADAQSGTNAISDPSAYRNTSNPQTVFYRIENNDTGCWSTDDFDLIVNPRPVVYPVNDMEVCDDDMTV